VNATALLWKSTPWKKAWSAEQVNLQSNVDFLQKLISKNASESHQKLDPAGRAIDDLKRAVAILQKSVSQLQAAEKRG